MAEENSKKLETSEIELLNNWQALGATMQYWTDNIKGLKSADKNVFFTILRHSFGYGKLGTPKYSVRKWIDLCGFGSTNTFYKSISRLENFGMIKVKKDDGWRDGGGTNPTIYYPEKPKGIHIKLIDSAKREKSGKREQLNSQAVEKEKGSNDYDW